MFNVRTGTAPRRARAPAVLNAALVALMTLPVVLGLLVALVPPRSHFAPDAPRIPLARLSAYRGDYWVDRALALRLLLALGCAGAGAAVAGALTWRRTPLSDCAVAFAHQDEPRLHRGEDAERALTRHLGERFGPTSTRGLWLAPGVRLPREAESSFVLVLGDKGSGKSNILRALASQAIARGDRVLLHCVKGDVTRAFRDGEAVLLGAHHAESWAWDAAADLDGEAAYMDLAAAAIPLSGSSAFWAQSARAVFVDVLHDLAHEAGRTTWTFADLAERLLDEPAAIKARVDRLLLSSGVLIEEGPDGLSNTAFGVLATLWAGALSTIRPLALAWGTTPPGRRFSVKRWLRGGGPRTVIVQTAPEYQELSALVSGCVLGRVATGVCDPSLPTDARRRVTLVLDELHALGPVRGFKGALALGREKGLVVFAALQSLAQLPLVYGPKRGQVVQDLFRIRVVSALAAGASADLASALVGARMLLWWEPNADGGGTGRYRRERGERRVVSPTTLTRDLGVRQVGSDAGDPRHKVVRAVVSGLGDAYLLDWPLTLWPTRREGYVPAPWLTASRRPARAPSAASSARTSGAGAGGGPEG